VGVEPTSAKLAGRSAGHGSPGKAAEQPASMPERRVSHAVRSATRGCRAAPGVEAHRGEFSTGRGPAPSASLCTAIFLIAQRLRQWVAAVPAWTCAITNGRRAAGDQRRPVSVDLRAWIALSRACGHQCPSTRTTSQAHRLEAARAGHLENDRFRAAVDGNGHCSSKQQDQAVEASDARPARSPRG